MKKFSWAFLAFLLFTTLANDVHARHRHHKFKGVVIVNQILKLSGTIKNNGQDAPEFSGVKQGDVLETGEKSEAVIRIPGLAIFKMGPETRFRLAKFNDRNDSRFDLEKGSVLAVYHRVGDHEFHLNHGTIKLHSTTFYAMSDAGKTKDQVCLCDGKIDLLADGTNDKGKHSDKTTQVTAVISPAPAAEPTPAAVVQSPTVSPSATSPVQTPAPTPTPLPKVIGLKSAHEHKQCEISAAGIEEKNLGLTQRHTDAEIQDLESMYALP